MKRYALSCMNHARGAVIITYTSGVMFDPGRVHKVRLVLCLRYSSLTIASATYSRQLTTYEKNASIRRNEPDREKCIMSRSRNALWITARPRNSQQSHYSTIAESTVYTTKWKCWRTKTTTLACLKLAAAATTIHNKSELPILWLYIRKASRCRNVFPWV